MTGAEALADRLAAALRSDEGRVLLGEDVADGGVFGWTRPALSDEGLAARVLAQPLAPSTTFSQAAGLALAGKRPIVLLPSAASLLDGMGDLLSAFDPALGAACGRPLDVTVVAPTGPGLGTAEDADRAVEALLRASASTRVYTVGRSDALLAALEAVLSETGPSVLLVPRRLLVSPISDESAPIPREGFRVLVEGTQAVVFAFGDAVEPALAAAGPHDAKVVELHRLSPMDPAGLAAHMESGRVVVAHPGPVSLVALEVAAAAAGPGIWYLDAPVQVVGGKAPPLGPTREADAVPSAEDLAGALAACGALANPR